MVKGIGPVTCISRNTFRPTVSRGGSTREPKQVKTQGWWTLGQNHVPSHTLCEQPIDSLLAYLPNRHLGNLTLKDQRNIVHV